MAVSLDGADAAAHDSFRQVSGSYDRTMAALRHAARIGLETQINTTVTRHNVESLDRIAQVVGAEKARLWSVFFLVVTGRAEMADDLTAAEYEQVFALLAETAARAPFDIKTTEAQHYRRYLAERREAGLKLAEAPADAIRRQAGINDGKGFVFISHTGEILPSGFLPLSAGNVRRQRLGEVYRNSALFRMLRDSGQLEGKCGRCEYRNLCGGSRSRAFALSGRPMGADPRCVYEPAA
jgi:radical SAM protein with 4Fe4S-binding SPASM domain